MKNFLSALKSMSPHKAILLALCIMVFFVVASLSIKIPDATNARLVNLLKQAGFEKVVIGSVSLRPNGVTAHSIKLDSYGFDSIENLYIVFSWPSFLLNGTVESVEMSGLSMTRQASGFKSVIQNSLMNLLSLPDYRFALDNAKLDMATSFGNLQFTINATVDRPDLNGNQRVGAHIVAEQYQLSFDSKWTGEISNAGKLDMAADFVDGRLHFGPMNVTRFNGWIGLSASDKDYSLQTQFGAGGADLFKVPLHDVSLVSDLNNAGTTMLFRSAMAGFPDVTLSADMSTSKDSRTFDMLLKGGDMGRFLHELAKTKSTQGTVPPKLDINKPFSLSSNYQDDRRFEGGPLPFSLDLWSGDSKILSGNYLIYTDVLDIRGSAEADESLANALQDYFVINDSQIEGNFIRLDGDLEALFGKQMAPKTP